MIGYLCVEQNWNHEENILSWACNLQLAMPDEEIIPSSLLNSWQHLVFCLVVVVTSTLLLPVLLWDCHIDYSTLISLERKMFYHYPDLPSFSFLKEIFYLLYNLLKFTKYVVYLKSWNRLSSSGNTVWRTIFLYRLLESQI